VNLVFRQKTGRGPITQKKKSGKQPDVVARGRPETYLEKKRIRKVAVVWGMSVRDWRRETELSPRKGRHTHERTARHPLEKQKKDARVAGITIKDFRGHLLYYPPRPPSSVPDGKAERKKIPKNRINETLSVRGRRAEG